MPKNVFRLAIGASQSSMSSVWRIWSEYKGDVYVSVRCLGGTYKMSLHKDGKCQFGFTKEYEKLAKERFGIENRHQELWRLPDEPIIRALQILIPASELREAEVSNPQKLTWLETPPAGNIGTISLFITAPDVKFDIPKDTPGASLVGKLETAIRNAWIAYAFTNPDDKLKRLVKNEKEKLLLLPTQEPVPAGTRATLWDSTNSHERHVLELAYDVNNGE
jgi:hypothetical protein